MKNYEGWNGIVSLPNKAVEILERADRTENVRVAQEDIKTLEGFKTLRVAQNDRHYNDNNELVETSYYIDNAKTGDCINVIYVKG